jgi:hypothetical protein
VAVSKPASAGLVLGIYYGGTGVGIVASALLVPALAETRGRARVAGRMDRPRRQRRGGDGHRGGGDARPGRCPPGAPAGPGRTSAGARSRPRSPLLPVRLGYIGYMTFVISLLREERLAGAVVVAFFVMLGSASSRRRGSGRGSQRFARRRRGSRLLNALVAAATLLPVVSVRRDRGVRLGIVVSGAVFLSLVASTTSLVRHNLGRPRGRQGSPPSRSSSRQGRSSDRARSATSPIIRWPARGLRLLGRGARSRGAARDAAEGDRGARESTP